MNSWSNSPVAHKIQGYLCSWMALGYFIFPMAFYLNPSKGGTANIFYLGVLLPWCLILLSGKINLAYKNSIYISTIILFSYLWANSLWSTQHQLPDSLYLLKWLVYVLCLMTAPIVIVEKYPQFYEKLLLFWFAASIIGSLIVIYSHINIFGAQFFRSRMVGWGFGFNSIALGLHSGIAVLVGLLLVDKYRKRAPIIILFCLVPLAAMMLSHSRGSIVALLICGVFALILFERSKAIIVTKVALLGSVAVAVIYIGWDTLSLRGFSGRPQIWLQVLEMAKESLLLGEGFSQQANDIIYRGVPVTHSHNVLIKLLRYGGLVAVALFLFNLYSLFKFHIVKGDSLTGYYLLILCFTLMVMFTSGWYLLDRPNYFWIGFWYPIGLLMLKQHQLESHD